MLFYTFVSQIPYIMKKYLLFLILISLPWLVSSCFSKKAKVTLVAEPMFVTTDRPDYTADRQAEIYKQRLLSYGIREKDLVVKVENNKIYMTFPEEKFNDDIMLLLTVKGEISFWEAYSYEQVVQYLIQTDSLIQNTSQEKLKEMTGIEADVRFALLPVVPYGDPVEANRYFSVGYIEVADTDMVMKCLEICSDFFPRDCRFMYTMKPPSYMEENEMLELLCLKSGSINGGPSISGGILTAEAKESGWGWEILLQMDEETSRNWERMTWENIGKAIAIVIDGKVLSYPFVQQKIEGGKSNIAGVFNESEARLYAAILSSGPLPMDAVITVQK